MLTRLSVNNFKLFGTVEIPLAERVVFVGPNNSGKTSALQALALWSVGVRRWIEKRGATVPEERSGVTINRRDLIAVPVPSADLLWRDLHVREGYKEEGKQKTRNVLIEIEVGGIDEGREWAASLEFYYANEESFYCRSKLGPDGNRLVVPPAAHDVRLAYLPPMSGLSSNETKLEEGAIAVRIGEGRTAEVLRNLCWRALEEGQDRWRRIVEAMLALFDVRLDDPRYIKERGEIVMSFRTRSGVQLDLSASGRGQQQTLLLLAHMAAHPGTVLLLDEPDAHLEVLRQRQIYQILTEAARETNSQIIAASHSEVILNEAADRDVVVAFIGTPHRIDDRGSQLLKFLKQIGFEHYIQAEEMGWVLYLEGATDLAILRAFARKLNHPTAAHLERPFVHYVGSRPQEARDHFYGLREAKQDLVAIAIYDRLEKELHPAPPIDQRMWRRREIESYLCQEETLLCFAEAEGRRHHGDIFVPNWRGAMESAIQEIRGALAALAKGDPWSGDLKVTDEFLDPLFRRFYEKLRLPILVGKTDYHILAEHVPIEGVDPEIREKLDAILDIAGRARPRGENR